MEVSLNCIFLGMTTLSDSFTVPICDKNDINGIEVNFNDLKIRDLKFLIWNKKKEMLRINDPDDLKLWKVALGDNLKDIITEEQIKNKGEELLPTTHFSEYFSNNDAVDASLVIIQVPATGKCLPMFYLSNKKFAVTKYRVWSDLFFFVLKQVPSNKAFHKVQYLNNYWPGMMSKKFLTNLLI